MANQYIRYIWSDLLDKEWNTDNADRYQYYSDVIGEHITDAFLSISKRIINQFIAWYMEDTIELNQLPLQSIKRENSLKDLLIDY